MSHPFLYLLHNGLTQNSRQLARPFAVEEWAASPLGLSPTPPDTDPSPIAQNRKLPSPQEIPWEVRQLAGLTCLAAPLPEKLPVLPAPLYLCGESTSTFDIAHALAQRGLLPEWGSVLALSQTAGRGQMRRSWSSPPGNVYAALRLPHHGPLRTEAAAPASGGLVAEALAAQGFAVAMKWPNDILQVKNEQYTQRDAWHKVGGVLLEERADILVAGIGLNLISAPSSSTLRDGAAFHAGVLQLPAVRTEKGTAADGDHRSLEKRRLPTVLTLWTSLVERAFSCYSVKSSEADMPWWPSLAQKHLAFQGWQAQLVDPVPACAGPLREIPDPILAEAKENMRENPVEGVIDGLEVSGALRLRTGSGIRTFLGGSLTPLRPGFYLG